MKKLQFFNYNLLFVSYFLHGEFFNFKYGYLLFFNFFFLLLFIHFCKFFKTSFIHLPSNPSFFSIVQILYNTIHVDTISTMFYNDTFIRFMTISKFQKLVEHTFELNFEMNSNEFCMVPIHSQVL